MKVFIGLLLILLLKINLIGQETVSSGFLLRMNFYQSTLDTTDIAGTWKFVVNRSYNSYEFYNNVFTINDTTFFLKTTDSENHSGILPGNFSTVLINSKTKNENYLFGGYYPECGTGVFLSSTPNILRTTRGIILNNNLIHSTYYLYQDHIINMCTPNNGFYVVHIVGKLKTKYLIVVENTIDYKFHYYLEEFDRDFKPEYVHEIKFTDYHSVYMLAPKKIYLLTDSLAIMNFEHDNKLLIVNFSDSLITKVDSLLVNSSLFWTVKNKKLFLISNNYLTKKEFVEKSKFFTTADTVMKISDFAFDIDENYFATMYSDTVFIYSLGEEKIVNKINISRLKNYSQLLIDPPWLYLHKLDKITGVNEPDAIKTTFQLRQNYPNPFNPSTVISYQLPVSGKVILKVYDVLGREVATLINEERQSGYYEFKFDGSNLTSGVYFYRLQSGSFNETKKFVLMK